MLYLILAIVLVAADQVMKYYISGALYAGEQASLIPGIVHLTNVKNKGIAFSFLSEANVRWILVGISAVCVIIILIVLFRSKMGPFGKVTLAMIMGGAAGNLIDRALYGDVLDMFEAEFLPFSFPVFNVADVCITLGVILFVIYYLIYSTRRDRRGRKELSSAGTRVSADEPAPDPAAVRNALEDQEEMTFTLEDILAEYHMENIAKEDKPSHADRSDSV